jgi:uncharacterized protein
MEPKFIVDNNAGKLAKLLRLIGYDTVFFGPEGDADLINAALLENRIILTRDTHIMERRVVIHGRLRVILITSDNPEQQIHQVISTLNLDCPLRPFALCLECNRPLMKRSKEEVKDLVPPYVFKTQAQYMQCPNCRRIYWQGTHWQRMTEKLARLCQNQV